MGPTAVFKRKDFLEGTGSRDGKEVLPSPREETFYHLFFFFVGDKARLSFFHRYQPCHTVKRHEHVLRTGEQKQSGESR